MASKPKMYFSVIEPCSDGNDFKWTLYKGKESVVSQGIAEDMTEAKAMVDQCKQNEGIV